MDVPPAAPEPARVEEFRRKHHTALVTLVFTDLVDSVGLRRQLGDQAATTLLQTHRQIVRELLQRAADAEEIETAGDSFLLLFARPSDAVKFALLLEQQTVALAKERNVALAVRIGIHVGEVVIEEHAQGPKPKDLYGSQIDLCARVMSVAQAGQILLSRAVFDSARQALKGEELHGLNELQWLDHGPYLLKGIDEPVDICEVGEAGVGLLKPPGGSEKAQRQVCAGEEPVLGWRPAVGQLVPNTRWQLEEKMGEGGFGEVWLGRHQHTKERRVFKFCFQAQRVRFLKREMTLFRLLKERVGDHPNIVRLHDVCLEQPPFYVEMDYVEGHDLRTWSEERGRVASVPLETRLEIVAQIADALQAAHEAGVIHRDVKPGNILIATLRALPNSGFPLLPNATVRQHAESDAGVASNGATVQAKLTDFGIGQVVSEEYLAGVTRAGFTQTIMSDSSTSHTGTQLYMAPELLAGKSASIRSDIYSLGVVLYQLIIGDFTRPVTTDWANEVLDPLLREDLRHCFAGNPQDRFVGAGQLAKNLRALPQRQATLAREAAESAARERRAYRHGYIRATGAAAVVVALITCLAIAALQQSHRARIETMKGTQVANFLKDMLKTVGPSVARGRDTTLLREILTNTVSRLDTEFSNQPEVESDLRLLLGRTYQDLGDYWAAAKMSLRALELRRQVFGPRHEAVGEALNRLASALSLEGSWAEAEQYQREALSIYQRNLGHDDPLVADMFNDLGIMLYNRGRLREAGAAYREALAIKVKALKPPNRKLADAHLNLSVLLLDLEEPEQGEKEAREALAMFRELFGNDHPRVAMALHNQGKSLRALGRLDEAESAIRAAIAIYGRVFVSGHDYHAEALDDLGLILQKKGDVEGAQAAFRQGIIMGKQTVGEDHPQTLRTTRHLALLLESSGAPVPEAEELMKRSTTLSREKFANEPISLAECLEDLANFYVQTGRSKEAEPVLLEAYQLLNKGTSLSEQGANHLARICRALESLYVGTGRPEEARKWASRRAEAKSIAK
jgi:serine/threonine-protein kinase